MSTTDPLYTLTVTTPDADTHNHGLSTWWTTTVDSHGALTCRSDDDEDDTCTAQHIYAAGNWASCHVEKVEPQRVSKPENVDMQFDAKDLEGIKAIADFVAATKTTMKGSVERGLR